MALAIAAGAIVRGFDAQVPAELRRFFYLPFEHSEDLVEQDQAVDFFRSLGDEEYIDFAIRHRAVIAKDRERDDVPRAEACRFERGLEASPGDPLEVVDQHERLVRRVGGLGAGRHAVHSSLVNHLYSDNLWCPTKERSTTKDNGMPTLLHIDSSMRTAGSRSRALSDHFARN